MDVIRWIWEKQFAAVAGDSPSWEVQRKFFPLQIKQGGILADLVKSHGGLVTARGQRKLPFPSLIILTDTIQVYSGRLWLSYSGIA